MKHLIFFCLFMFTVLKQQAQSCTLTYSYTAPSCSACCNGSAMITNSGSSCATSYTWFPGFITGATAVNLCAGSYTVYANGNSCCGTFTTQIIIPNGPTGINSMNARPDDIYFNSTTNILMLGVGESVFEVHVSDLWGKKIIRSDVKEKMDLSYLEQGIYIVTIVTGSKRYKLKIYKK
jgi:hypothetical protein